MLKELIPWSWGKRDVQRATETPPSEPAIPLLSLQREMNRVFDAFWRGGGVFGAEPFGFGHMGSMGFAPTVEVSEGGKEVVVKAELPGMDESDVKVTLSDGVLRIEGEKRTEESSTHGGTYHSEIRYGSFSRSLPVRSEIDADKIQAVFKKGVLTVTLPKTESAQKQVRKIEVNAA